jgi:hypothetical protein
MDWEYQNNMVTHLETGLTIHIDEGSFSTPFSIKVESGNLHPIVAARLTRMGIAFGSKHEYKYKKRPCFQDNSSDTTIRVKKRRQLRA